MSTRAVYSFSDERGTHHVYKHHDGYPSGAAEAISNAIGSAWQLPRFEADEFAAAFVRANKSSGGGIRLTHGPQDHGDLEYRYEITANGNGLQVRAYDTPFGDCANGKEIFSGSLSDFVDFAQKTEEA